MIDGPDAEFEHMVKQAAPFMNALPQRGAPPMPTTKARQYRLDDETVSKMLDLAAKWGGTIKPLSDTEVIREAIRRAHKSEIREARKKS
jgi:hypothetical protein